MTELKRADLVLSGGGVKGVGLVGAVVGLLDAGYAPQRVSGTSAGSIVGAIVAAAAQTGAMTGSQVKDPCAATRLPASSSTPVPLERVPVLGPSLALLRGSGIYRGDYAHDWVRAQLADLGVHTFGDLAIDDDHLPPEQRYRLVVTVADVTTGAVGPTAVGLPQGLRPRPRRAVGRRRRPRVDVHPVLLPAGLADQRHRSHLDARRRRPAVELPDRLARPDGRQDPAVAQFRRHAAAEPARRQRQGDSGAGAAAPAGRAASARGRHHHRAGRPRPGLPEPAVGRRPRDPRGLDRRRDSSTSTSPTTRSKPSTLKGYAAAEKFLAGWDWAAYLRRFR